MLAGCDSNSAPRNDGEAHREAPAGAAPRANAATVLSGIATGAIQPETVTEADIDSLGGREGHCVLRMTELGYPSFLFGGEADSGTIKLNGQLIALPLSGEGVYRDGGLSVRIRSVDAEADRGGRRETEMLIMLPGAEDEIGFRGFEECGRADRSS